MKYSEDTLKKRIEYYYNIINNMIDTDINLEEYSKADQIKEYLKSVESNDLYLLKNYISEIQSPWNIKGITDPIKVACKNNYLIDIIDTILEERLEVIRQQSGV